MWTTDIAGTRVRPFADLAFASLLLGALFPLALPHCVAGPQENPPSQSRPSDPYTISVKVDMVALHATVRNRKGIPVSGLGKEDFQVCEDGVPQQIIHFSQEDVPVTVGLVVDNSGSMKPKRAEVFAAALAFANSSNPEDQMFAVSFNENVSFGLPSDMPFTDKGAELVAALSQMEAGGMTALYDAVAAALEQLKKGSRDKKVLVVVSDGGDNASRHSLAQLMAMAGQPDAIIYTVGLFDVNDPDQRPGVLRRLAETTGGEAFLPRSPAGVAPVFKRIARDIRIQYTLAYLPSNRKQDGAYRVIQVKAGTRGGEPLSVRTRAGYYAPSKPQPFVGRRRNQP